MHDQQSMRYTALVGDVEDFFYFIPLDKAFFSKKKKRSI